MRKTVMTLAALAVTVTAGAEGYQINTLSAKQLGMGHAGVAMHLGAESMYFNPAGLGFMDDKLDLSASVAGIMPHVTATLPDGREFSNVSDVSTPLAVSAAFSIYDNFKAGVAVYTPYGSAIDWTNNWPGAVLNQKVKLATYTIQPTFSWRPLPNLSVGAGVMVTWGNVDLNKGLVSPETADKVQALQAAMQGRPTPEPFGSTVPASVNLKGTAKIAVGANVGVMWDIDDRWTAGASFRTEMPMKVEAGDASVIYANEAAKQLLSALDVLNSTNFEAKMPCPWVLSFGLSYKPIKSLTLAADARLTGWNSYKTLDIEFLDEQCSAYNQHIAKNYKNAWAVSLGAQYGLTERFDLRAGLMIDTTPVNKDFYNPETPGMTKIEPTVGLSFRPIDGFSIDFAFMYIAGVGLDNASCTYPDLLAAKFPALGLPVEKTFTADYRLHAFSPSIGVSYKF